MRWRPNDVALGFVGIGLLCGCASSGGPSADAQAVRSTVQAFFNAMETRDVAGAGQTMIPEGVFVSVRTADGSRQIRHFNNAEWLERLASRKRDVREAFEGEPTVLIDGDVGVVWAPYTFEVDGTQSHTGVNAFTLIRTDEGWRIAGGAYSMVSAPGAKP